MSANIQSSPNMSSSYMYRNSHNKTTRPPTLPQYTTPTSIQTKGEMFFKSTETTAENSNLDKPPKHPTESTQEIVKKLNGYVGFANLPNQVYRKAVEKGFEFTLMVVGESGLGKSTLINSMFMSEIYGRPTQRLKKTVAVETSRVMLEENGVKLLLTMVDTPGFGDAVDNSNCWLPVIEYIESKYEDYLYSESRVVRKQITDQRVHCCLYFIQPSGHGLKPLDIEFMKHLCDKVNIIPVIAKADTLTSEECALFKKQILYEIAQNKIKIYEFPDTSNDGEEDKLNKSLKDRVPFAVVGSNTVVEIDGKKVRGRKYPWGIVQVDNLAHCDLMALRDMLIRTHLLDLKEVTSNVHYENYRFRKLTSDVDGLPSLITKKNPIVQMEAEMEEVLEMKVRERKQKLKDSEAELTRRHEATKKQLEQQVNELKEKRRQFELEKENQMRIDRKSLEGKKEKKKKGLF